MGDPVVVITDASGPNERRDRFESFVAANGDRLLRAAYGMCGDWQHAEDLVQVVLCKLADHWDDIATNPLGYAYRCLTRETAALLGISTGAVKSGASRGLARLRAARRSEFEELE